MADLWWPDVRLKGITPKFADATGRFTSPLAASLRTVARPGDRWGFRLDYQNLAYGVDRARLESIIGAMRGAANRLAWSPIIDYPQRGSFPNGELFAHNGFDSGTTGWGTQSQLAISAADRVLRVTRIENLGTGSGCGAPTQTVSLTQGLPYLIRFFIRQGRGFSTGLGIYETTNADGVTAGYSNYAYTQGWTPTVPGFGLLAAARVMGQTGNYQYATYGPINGLNVAGEFAGHYYDVVWASCSQCALVDNAGNLLEYSDDFTQSVWTKSHATISSSATAAPDGSSTALSLTDDTSTGLHYMQQNFTVGSAAQDLCIYILANPAARSFLRVQMTENTGVTAVSVDFNLSTGASGTGITGANWANTRPYSTNLGNGWWLLQVVSRKTNAATSISAQFYLETADNTPSYTGTNAGLLVWRAGVWPSGTPVNPAQATSAPVAAATQSGSAMRIKGLPPNTNGLLLAGDWCEINYEPKKVTAELNSDGCGRGYLQFSPPMRSVPADNQPLVTNSPFGRFVLANNEASWASVPPRLSTSSIDIIEAPQ